MGRNRSTSHVLSIPSVLTNQSATSGGTVRKAVEGVEGVLFFWLHKKTMHAATYMYTKVSEL